MSRSSSSRRSIRYSISEVSLRPYAATPTHSLVFSTLTRSVFPSTIAIVFIAGIYQPETFKRESKYGLTVLTSTDQGLLTYLRQVMTQMTSWLTDGDVQRLVVVVTGIDSGETLERWQFNVCVEDGGVEKVSSMGVVGKNENVSHNVVNSENILSGDNVKGDCGPKTVKDVHDEIQAIIRQITASVSQGIVLAGAC